MLVALGSTGKRGWWVGGEVCSSRYVFSGGISTTNATENDLDVDLNVHNGADVFFIQLTLVCY